MDPEPPVDTFLKADEVDEPGVVQQAPLPPPSIPEQVFDPPLDTVEEQDLPGASGRRIFHDVPQRPLLRRDKWAQPPQQPPPPAPPQSVQDPTNPTDSLSLMQLKKLVTEMPKVEPTPYTFEYEDFSRMEEEIEELFGYSAEEQASLLRAQETFVVEWEKFNGVSSEGPPEYENGLLDWRSRGPTVQIEFLRKVKEGLMKQENGKRLRSLECLLYLVLGCWNETAGLQREQLEEYRIPEPKHFAEDSKFQKSWLQLSTIQENIRLINEHVGVQQVYEVMRQACVLDFGLGNADAGTDENQESQEAEFLNEQWTSLIIMYLIVDAAARDDGQGVQASSIRQSVLKLEPPLLTSLTDLLAELRWDDSNSAPPAKLLQLYWKAMLVTFGPIEKTQEIKRTWAKAHPDRTPKDDQPQITASPLDYHIFRQEITSKYPVFNPPPPLFPFEPESNSILPSLYEFANREGQNKPEEFSNIQGNGASILHQPVHIATPAPSPPPSPAGPGGKGVKKQNYQTNQMLPFLYPPLNEMSNEIGGKGSTELQDALVGRKWEGSDIPASILEATDLFSQRMRATRAMKQLWEERVRFVKYERGYGMVNEDESDQRDNKHSSDTTQSEMELDELSHDLKQRLEAVEMFYKHSVPNLQSVIIVLLKILLQTVTTLVVQPNVMNSLQTGSQDISTEGNAVNGRPETDPVRTTDPSLVELDNLRTQEIMGKSVSGCLFLLLKWFKLSHILKFEYLTQLLLDSNYVQLILKLFTHQELERAVNFKCESEVVNFFNFCLAHSRHGGAVLPSPEQEIDDAVPPPIRDNRNSTGAEMNSSAPGSPQPAVPQSTIPPEVDELGYPLTEIPAGPITEFSWRTFFSSINHLRILQKIVKSKPHRQLLMVQYKYSNVLKKSLKVPQPDIRLYTLKIIKGQVPYCHRKWRQSNMRIITAIYLHCRPALRDEWLAGVDVDAEMGEALPQEQALRALTYWYNLRRYPEEMGMAEGKEDRRRFEEEEQDFFVRELERMDMAAGADGDAGAPEPDEQMEDPQMEEMLMRARAGIGVDGQRWDAGPMEGWS